MAAADIISNYLEETKAQLIQSYISKGLKASGSFERGLQSSVRDTGRTIHGEITSEGHAWFMQEGRKPNKKASEEDWKKWAYWATNEDISGGGFLKKWMRDKGIVGNAFMMAYGIAKRGSSVPNPYNQGNLFTDIFTEQWEQKMIDRVKAYYVRLFETEITTDLKKLIAK